MRGILFLTLSLAALTASAQEAKWSYGVTLTPSYFSYWTVDSDDVLEYRGRANFGFGFSLSHHPSDKLSIFFNPEFHTRNFLEIIDTDAFRGLDPNDPTLFFFTGDIEYKQRKKFIDLTLGVSYHPADNFLLITTLSPSVLISESVEVEPSVVAGNEKGISEFNWLLGIGPGYMLNAFGNWGIQFSASINIFLKQFHDFFPEENPILFQVKFALLKSKG
ncbi:MAG: hypothetical protein ACFB2Y_09245 [Fulvivirga sp.]